MIHPSAIIHESARLGAGVSVGPWTTIGANVEIGEDTWVGSHVVIEGPTSIGARNRIYPFNSIGDVPQDKKFSGEASRLEIGDDNVIRENCTLNRGTGGGGGVTRIGDRNWIMAYVHVAHDCQLGSDNTMANAATLAGHVEMGDFITLGAFTVVHQFCQLGSHCFSAMGTVVLKDVVPYVTLSGNPAQPHGINTEGLRRRGFDPSDIAALRRAYKVVFRQGLTKAQAQAQLAEDFAGVEAVKLLIDCLERSTRGIAR